MAQVNLPFGIVAIHGRLGNLIYRSRKQPDGSYKVFVHEAPPRKKHGSRTGQCPSNNVPTSSQLREINGDNEG